MFANIVFLLALVVGVDAAVPKKWIKLSKGYCGETVHLSQATVKKSSSHPAFAQIWGFGASQRQDEYVLAKESMKCPEGSKTLETEAACTAGAEALGLDLGDTENDAKWPSGCYQYKEDDMAFVFFNTNPNAKAVGEFDTSQTASTESALCRKEPAADSKEESPSAPAQSSPGSNPGYPGTGIDLKEMTREIFKDGYFPLTCQKDYLLEFGDKYGPNKHAYKIGQSAGVSIVRYEDWTAKEDRAQMSVAVCFDFCRSVPNMQFFGLFAGRECYCAPYTQMLASDDTATCDLHCPGDATQMCGGKQKSSIFEMHMCGDTDKDLAELEDNGRKVLQSLGPVVANGGGAYHKWQDVAAERQGEYGQHGDTGASNTMQEAKVAAGFFGKIWKAADQADGQLSDALKAATEAKGVRNKEKAIAAGESALAKAKVAEEELREADTQISPHHSASKSGESIKGYSTLMYLVDKAHENDVSTCGGTIMGWIVGPDHPDNCAQACDDRPLHCVGFSFHASIKGNLCGLFSKFRDVAYYPECSHASFLQKVRKASDVDTTKCYAKFAALGEMDLSPDASGKCKHCLRNAVHKEGCFE